MDGQGQGGLNGYSIEIKDWRGGIYKLKNLDGLKRLVKSLIDNRILFKNTRIIVPEFPRAKARIESLTVSSDLNKVVYCFAVEFLFLTSDDKVSFQKKHIEIE